jgi:hypothetical protein
MSLHSTDEMATPEETTVRVASAAFPEWSVYMRMCGAHPVSNVLAIDDPEGERQRNTSR